MNAQIEFYQHKLDFEIDTGDLFDAIEKNETIVVVDSRRKEAYDKEHIPVAISLPHRDMSEESTLGFDKSTLYVCYCDGIGCNASTQGAFKLAKLGFNVKEVIGGLEWWKRNNFETAGNQATAGTKLSCLC